MQGHLENLMGLGQDIKVGPPHDVVTALIEYLTVLLEYIDLLGPPANIAQGKLPQVPPVGGPAIAMVTLELHL